VAFVSACTATKAADFQVLTGSGGTRTHGLRPRAQAKPRQEPPRSDPLPQTTTRPHRLHRPQSGGGIDIGATLAQGCARSGHREIASRRARLASAPSARAYHRAFGGWVLAPTDDLPAEITGYSGLSPSHLKVGFGPPGGHSRLEIDHLLTERPLPPTSIMGRVSRSICTSSARTSRSLLPGAGVASR
jgi:hypothetical protein